MDITKSGVPLLNKYGQHLKSLKLDLSHLTPPYMSYLVLYPPNQLNTLHLNSNEDLCEWLNHNTEEVLISFAKGLSSIKDLKLCFSNDLDILQLPEKKDTSIFYKFLVSLKADRLLRCDVKYQISNCAEISIEVRGGNCICLTYQTDRYNSYSNPSDDENAPFSVKNNFEDEEDEELFGDSDKKPMEEDDEEAMYDNDIELLNEEDGGYLTFESNLKLHDSNSNIAMIAPEMINSISYLHHERSPIATRQMIKYITRHFPNIDYFDGSTMTLNIKTGPRNGLLYRKRSNTVTSTTQDNLKAVLLNFLTLTPRLIQTVASYLPNFEVLLCNYPGWHKMGGSSKNKKNNDWIMDVKLNITRLKKLQEFYIDIDILFGRTVCLFFQFEYVDSVDVFYYNVARKPGSRYEHAPITAAFIDGYRTTNPLRCNIITIECKQDTKIILHDHSSCNIIGTFYNGQLEVPSSLTFISPYYCNQVGVSY